MKYLITGGAGFIGGYLGASLLEAGHQVTILDDLSTGRYENVKPLAGKPGCAIVVDTILNEMVLDRLASECDAIFHLAAAVGVKLIVDDPFHTIRTNVIGTDCVLKAACRYRRKILIASTSEIYGKNTKVPFSESDDTTCGPTYKQRWAYATSKAMDEFAAFACARSHGLPVVIVRLFNTIGPRQTGRYGMVAPTFMRQAMRGEPITVYGDGKQSRCFTNVNDVVGAMVKLSCCPAAENEVVNIGSEELVDINHLAEQCKQIAKSQSPIVHVPYDEAYQKGFEDMMIRMPNLEKVKRLIGYEPKVRLDETLRQIHAHMVNHPDD